MQFIGTSLERCGVVYLGPLYLLDWITLHIFGLGGQHYVIHVYYVYDQSSWGFQCIPLYKRNCGCVIWGLDCCKLDVNNVQVENFKTLVCDEFWWDHIFSVIVCWDIEWRWYFPWYCFLDIVVQAYFHDQEILFIIIHHSMYLPKDSKPFGNLCSSLYLALRLCVSILKVLCILQ